MRALTRKARQMLILTALALCAFSLGALAEFPLWGFVPADSSSWRGDTLSLAIRAGDGGHGSFTLVNESDAPLGPFHLQLSSDLFSASGGSIPSSALSFVPATVPELTAGESATVTVSVNPLPQTPLEIYRASFRALLGDMSIHDQAVLELRVRGEENLRVAPNPFFGDRHRSVEFRVAATAGMSVSIDLFTMGMEKVRTLYSGGAWSSEGVETLSWDLTNESGHRVAAGVYLALARFDTGGERFTETHRVMLVY